MSVGKASLGFSGLLTTIRDNVGHHLTACGHCGDTVSGSWYGHQDPDTPGTALRRPSGGHEKGPSRQGGTEFCRQRTNLAGKGLETSRAYPSDDVIVAADLCTRVDLVPCRGAGDRGDGPAGLWGVACAAGCSRWAANHAEGGTAAWDHAAAPGRAATRPQIWQRPPPNSQINASSRGRTRRSSLWVTHKPLQHARFRLELTVYVRAPHAQFVRGVRGRRLRHQKCIPGPVTPIQGDRLVICSP